MRDYFNLYLCTCLYFVSTLCYVCVSIVSFVTVVLCVVAVGVKAQAKFPQPSKTSEIKLLYLRNDYILI